MVTAMRAPLGGFRDWDAVRTWTDEVATEIRTGQSTRQGGCPVQALSMTGWQSAPRPGEVEVPRPGPGEVLLRIGGAGVCHSELHVLYEFPPDAMPWRLPFTVGHENSGWIEELGAGVRGLETGQPVAVHGPWGCGTCRACAAGAENYCRTPGAGAALVRALTALSRTVGGVIGVEVTGPR